MRSFKSPAFTLAEIMIVLTVVGVLTAILLPAAINSAPDENVVKFKKANSTLGTVIRELANSDKYHSEGDLGKYPDGTLITSPTYFCESLADILNVKTKNCSSANTIQSCVIVVEGPGGESWQEYYADNGRKVTPNSIKKARQQLDEFCRKSAKEVGEELKTADNIVYYNAKPVFAFGSTHSSLDGKRYLSSPHEIPTIHDENGFDAVYKIFCIDVDGIPSNVSEDDCINECPFGYGIRADGKILPGERAEEWINKSVQNKE